MTSAAPSRPAAARPSSPALLAPSVSTTIPASRPAGSSSSTRASAVPRRVSFPCGTRRACHASLAAASSPSAPPPAADVARPPAGPVRSRGTVASPATGSSPTAGRSDGVVPSSRPARPSVTILSAPTSNVQSDTSCTRRTAARRPPASSTSRATSARAVSSAPSAGIAGSVAAIAGSVMLALVSTSTATRDGETNSYSVVRSRSSHAAARQPNAPSRSMASRIRLDGGSSIASRR